MSRYAANHAAGHKDVIHYVDGLVARNEIVDFFKKFGVGKRFGDVGVNAEVQAFGNIDISVFRT